MTRRSPTVDIVIADDHPIFRDGLRKLLEDEDGFRVVGEAANGEEAVKLARELEPDVLLLDVAMPRCSGLEALRQLAASELRVRPILLTVAVGEKDFMEALHLEARGVVLKESATELLFKAIRAVMAGQHWIGRTTVTDLVRYFRERASAGTMRTAAPVSIRLTPHERQIVVSVAAGQSKQGDRRSLLTERGHGQAPPDADLREARRLEPGRARRPRHAEAPRRGRGLKGRAAHHPYT